MRRVFYLNKQDVIIPLNDKVYKFHAHRQLYALLIELVPLHFIRKLKK